MAQSVRKNFTLTSKELAFIEQIKDRALNKKIVLNESEIVRFGLYLVAQLPEDKLFKIKELGPKK